MRFWLWPMTAVLLISCTTTPPPPVKPDPQLELAVRLAEQTIDKIVTQHVTPIDRRELVAQFTRLTHQALADETPVTHRQISSGNNIADVVRTLHNRYSTRPVLAAVESALSEITRGLDDRSVYLDRKQTRALNGTNSNAEAAIGVFVRAVDQYVVINEVITGSPAERAGLKAGDKILDIDGDAVNDKALESVETRLQGEPGSRVVLKVGFEDGDSRSISLQREKIALTSVDARWLTHGVAYLRVRSLRNSTVDEFNRGFLGLIRKVGAPRGLVLDLRDNTGGLLDAAVQLTDIFLEQGTILKVRGRAASDVISYAARPKSEVLEHKLPIVVLINHNTGSGSESMAAALQDHQRAVLVGNRTMGLGLVHSLYTLPGGRALKLATNYLYRPSGKMIEQQGVVPDVCVSGKQYQIIKQTKDKSLPDTVCKREAGRLFDKPDVPLQLAQQILSDKTAYRQLIAGTLTMLQEH